MLLRLKLASTFLLLALMLSFLPAGSAVQHAFAASSCYSAKFIADVDVPDGTKFTAGEAFIKTWKIQNNGTCEWSAVSLVFYNGDQMSVQDPAATLAAVAINQTVDISVKLIAPTTPGTYTGYFKFKSADGSQFGIGASANSSIWVKIIVPSSGGPSVVTTAYDFTVNAASAAWKSGTGDLTFPGTDGNASGFALKLDKAIFEDNKDYGLGGLLMAPNNTSNGFIQAIYPAFKIQSGDRFVSRIGCQTGATTCYVEYRLDYQIDGSSEIKTFLRPQFPFPFREKNEGLTYPVNVNLSSLAGQNVKFILVVNAYDGSAAGDRALWLNPIITRSDGVSPTITPTPTTTPSPAGTCTDGILFVKDVTVRDGTSFSPSAAFTKTWQFKNIGTCTWTTAYQLIFDSGDKMGGPDSAPMPISVAPGNNVEISVNLTAPATAGTYKGFWKFKNNNGVAFGLIPFGNIVLGNQKAFWTQINVSGAVATKAITLTTTANPLTYNTAGQVITFTYVIKNTGSVTLGPTQFTVSDSLIGATPMNCGAAAVTLDPNATLTCAATYTITAANLAVASIANSATASGGGTGPSPVSSATVAKQ